MIVLINAMYRESEAFNIAIMVNISRTAVTISLLGNRGWLPLPREENAFYCRSRGIPAADSPAPDTPAGWRVVVLPATAVLQSSGFPAGFYRSRSGAKLYPRANPSIAPYSRTAKVFLYQRLFCMTCRFRDISVQIHPFSGISRNFARFRLSLQRRRVRHRLHIWQLGRSNGGVAQ